MIVKQRDIFLVPFPYSDLSGQKVRPVLVLSNDRFNTSGEDAIVCSITSNRTKGPFAINISHENLSEGVLYAPCQVKVESVLKLDKKMFIKKIGVLKKEVFSDVLRVFHSIFELIPKLL